MHPGQEVHVHDFDAALTREWLLPNGLGGYAAGTAAGVPARRTHGLLVTAALHGRQHSLLLHLEDRAASEGVSHPLSFHCTAEGGRPAAAAAVQSFELAPWPTWRFLAGGTLLEKTIFTLHRHHAVVVSYRHLAGPDATISASPLLVSRAPETLQEERADLRGVTGGVPGRVRIELLEGEPALTLWHSGSFLPARAWQRGIAYPLDAETGDEAAFMPGHVVATIGPGRALYIVASTEDDLFRALAAEERLGVPPPKTLAECVAALDVGERERLARWRRAALQGADFTARQAAAAHGGPNEAVARRRDPLLDESHACVGPLALALRSGLARRGLRTALLTSLPDASERGADALRAVPALVALRAFDAARDVLRGYVEYLDEGLAPERFDLDDGSPVYGDAAPALWLVYAADLYARRSADGVLLSETLFPALEGVMQFHRSGTHHGIRVDADGLLVTGEGGAALKRADLNALWYHALVAMAQLARLIGRKESGAFYLAWAHDHQKRFNDAMWDEERGCLYEALGEHGPMRGLSPGQLLAVSLPPALLPPERAARLVDTIEAALFTPCGLRESPRDTRVTTAWLGPFVTAWLRVHQRSPEAHAQVRTWLGALQGTSGSGIHGYIPAGFEYEPRAGALEGRGVIPGSDGSTLAAAELLRLWIEEVDHGVVTAAETTALSNER
jgi:Glycogen debranching enzyme N terminal/Amylo-alpha-1,6-glucosidase